MSDEIEKLRREIDALDDQLAALLNRRAALAPAHRRAEVRRAGLTGRSGKLKY